MKMEMRDMQYRAEIERRCKKTKEKGKGVIKRETLKRNMKIKTKAPSRWQVFKQGVWEK